MEVTNTGIELIAQERQRQIEKEGWTVEHDDHHESGELGRAGACYEQNAHVFRSTPPHNWPWDAIWWKPKNYLSDMVRAGALYLAESERQERSGDSIKAEFWKERANIVANRLDKYLNSTPKEGK